MNSSAMQNHNNREPAVAGKFYPANQSRLKETLNQLFSQFSQPPEGAVAPRGLISPHAGYEFGGKVAAAAFSQIPKKQIYQRVFILASSHRFHFNGAALFNGGNYKTPLGEIMVDKDITPLLINASSLFHVYREAHEQEHSLEVQLPFLQYKLGKQFQLVPIILGTNNREECKTIADALKPWFTPENLFIISTDFSHYPQYDDAIENDRITAGVISQNNPDKLFSLLKKNRKREIPLLETSLCGWSSVLTLLYLTRKMSIRYEQILYLNSGDSSRYGDKNRVVGYWAIALYDKENAIKLTAEEQKELIQKARRAIIEYLKTRKTEKPEPPVHKGLQNLKAGVFVSIYIKDKLRGCIGNFSDTGLLSDLTQRMAISAANDYRFNNPEIDEISDMVLEISVLSPLKKIDSINEIIPGRDGIYIKKGSHTGTFLPQVATKTGWNRQELLEHCAKDKAGLDKNGWKDAEIFTYEAFIFKG